MRCFRVFLLALLVIVPLSSAASAEEEVQFEVSELTLHTKNGDHELTVELALTASQRQRGLMFRTELEPDTGMLFDLGETRPASMWMANTLISLDMVFITADGIVSGVHDNAEPGSKAIIRSKEPVRYVLEIGGGLAEQYGVKAGDSVTGPAMIATGARDIQ